MQRMRDIAPGLVCIAITLSLAIFHAWTDADAERKQPLPTAARSQAADDTGQTDFTHFALLNSRVIPAGTLQSVEETQ